MKRQLFRVAILSGISLSCFGMAQAHESNDKEQSSNKKTITITMTIDADGISLDTDKLGGIEDIANVVRAKLHQITGLDATEFPDGKQPKGDAVERKKQKRVMVLTDDGDMHRLPPGVPVWVRRLAGMGHDTQGEKSGQDKQFVIVKQRRTRGERKEEPTYRMGVAIMGTAGLRLGESVPGTPAEAAGLKSGDLLVTVDSESLDDVEQLMDKVQSAGAASSALTLGIVRNAELVSIEVVPKPTPNDDESVEEGAEADIEMEMELDDEADDHSDHHADDKASRKSEKFTFRWHPESGLSKEHMEKIESAKATAHAALQKAHEQMARQMQQHVRGGAEAQAAVDREIIRAVRQLRQEVKELRTEVQRMRESADEE